MARNVVEVTANKSVETEKSDAGTDAMASEARSLEVQLRAARELAGMLSEGQLRLA